MSEPVEPDVLVGDDWMEDKAAREEFEKGLNELDEKLKPLSDALEQSERLSEEDFAIHINTRD